MQPRFCSDCGAPVARQDSGGQAVIAVCPECGQRAVLRPPVTAAGILTRDGADGPEVLLVRRRPEVHVGGGRYCLPAKVVEWGEDVRDAVAQAFWEQSGLRVEVGPSYEAHSSFSDADRLTVGLWFRVEPRTHASDPTPGGDADAAEFFPLSRLPSLAYPTERLVFQRLEAQGVGQADAAPRDESDAATRLHQRKRKYRELLEAYTNELMRAAWINDLHLALAKLDSTAAITSVAAHHIASRADVDEARIWLTGPPDRCETCPWADRCSRDGCLHLVASANDSAHESDIGLVVATPQEPDEPELNPEEERIPLIQGVPAADVALENATVRAELPGAGASPRRFTGFPLHLGDGTPGVLGLISRAPMEPNARKLYEVVARHVATLVRNAQLVEDLRTANQVKQGFIARMSHELKTPLTAILGYAELLREELVADGHTLGADGAATIEESGRKLLGIVESILEIAKLQSGAVRFHPDRVSLTRIVEEVADAFYSRAREKGLEFSFHRADNEARTTVWADAERVKQALEHLLDNAVKFTSQGSVEITLVPGDEQVTCEVADTGIGIRPEYHKLIFEAFHQVSEKIHIDFGGLGIGLAFAKILIERQGGRIWVESQVGQGSRFFFSLPRSATRHKRATERVARARLLEEPAAADQAPAPN